MSETNLVKKIRIIALVIVGIALNLAPILYAHLVS